MAPNHSFTKKIVLGIVVAVLGFAAPAALTSFHLERVAALAVQIGGAAETLAEGGLTAAPAAAGSRDANLQAVRRAQQTVFIGGILGAVLVTGVFAWVGIGAARGLQRTVGFLKDVASGDVDLTKRLPLRYVNCSEFKECGEEECASYDKEEACWSHVGSMQLIAEKIQCPGVLSGKVEDCSQCPVFQAVETDELSQVANWLNIFLDKIRYPIIQARDAGLEMASVAQQLSATTAEIAASNEELCTQSEGVATASEEMTATVEDVAHNTVSVSEVAQGARQASADGARVVSEAVEAISDIASVVEQSAGTSRALGGEAEKIGVVVEVIQDIADQTNLLALNAAIEAARAGEHGRGFAVVADEVRKLAEKTVKATHEISATITSIQAESRQAVEAIEEGQKTVRKGAELGNAAGDAVHGIEGMATQASEQIQQIATAAEELSATIRETASNLIQMARGVEQNTIAAVEISQTTDAVAAKVGELNAITERFRI
jgi:methyl-accepting chemotaxis protein